MLTLIDTLLGTATHTAPRTTPFGRLTGAMALHRSRARLAELDPHLLADVGLTRADAEAEANRSVWDAPETWKA